jgi:hypothetical protein
MRMGTWCDRVLTGMSAAALSAALMACGQSSTTPAAAPAASTPAPAAAPAKLAASLTLVEPTDGVFSGHIDLFRWTAAEGADGYVIRILGSDGRLVFESPVLTATEARLPKTVGLEPEAHTWSVTARKGGEVIATSPTFKFSITP